MTHNNIALPEIAALAIATVSGAASVFTRSKPEMPIHSQYIQQAPQRQQQRKAQMFVGTVRKARHGFVPRTRGRVYRFEGAGEPPNYVGKRVKMRAILNFTARTVEVSNIQPTS